MGACCGGRPVDEEINNAKDINEIIQIFEGRKNKFQIEKKILLFLIFFFPFLNK